MVLSERIYPGSLSVDLDREDLARVLRNVLNLYKLPANGNPERFVSELLHASKGDEPPAGVRRFLDWTEAARMIAGGMTIGSHTHSHTVLSQLGCEAQRNELLTSQAEFRKHLGTQIDALAYPVGIRSAFTEETQALTRECGFQVGFSFYGGVNRSGITNPYDVRRVGIGEESWTRFRTQTSVCSSLGRYWP